MSDFSAITMDYNSGAGTEGVPVWTGTTLAFGGSAGANEWRFIDTGAGGGPSIGSGAWPYTTRPAAGTAPVRQLYAYSADTVGLQVTTYDGGRTNNNVIRIHFSNDGTLASAQRISAFANNTSPAPSPGTQGGSPTDGANIVNGHATDTGSHSYLKGNAFGSGKTAAGVQETPPTSGGCGTTLAVTSGAAGSVSPPAGAWLATWQSMQGWNEYITAPAIPQAAVSVWYWYVSLALFMGVNMLPGVMPFCPLVLDYTYA